MLMLMMRNMLATFITDLFALFRFRIRRDEAEKRVVDSLAQIWKLKFDHKAKCLSQVKHKVWSRFEVEVHEILK